MEIIIVMIIAITRKVFAISTNIEYFPCSKPYAEHCTYALSH